MFESRLHALRHSFLFSSIDPQNLSKIARIISVRSFDKREIIFQEGEVAQGFFVVANGSVKIYKLALNGSEHILHIINDGGSFAEAVVFGSLKLYPAFAEALEKTEVLFVPKNDFLNAMKSDFTLTKAVMASLAEKLRYFNTLVEELSLKEADARLAKYLLDLSFKKNSASFKLDVKKTELAGRLGIVPETLSRILRRFKRQSIIRLLRDEITILKKPALQSVSSGEK
ncbi:MAG: Crp/Fnr family transcriptional regulator [Candidatus Omnitrophota bacterium]